MIRGTERPLDPSPVISLIVVPLMALRPCVDPAVETRMMNKSKLKYMFGWDIALPSQPVSSTVLLSSIIVVDFGEL